MSIRSAIVNEDGLARFDRAARTTAVYEVLLDEYGRPTWSGPSDPFEALVRTIIAQHTSSPNKERALAQLRERFPIWDMLADAPLIEIVDALYSAGLANQKAKRLQALTRQILDERGDLDLTFLDEMPLEAARTWLSDLPGVGPLTASLVLLFACGRPALPVNTGLHRCAQRIGMIPPNVGARRAHRILQAHIDADEVYAFHVNMVRHSRKICRSSRPRCGDCVVAMYCDYVHDGSRRSDGDD